MNVHQIMLITHCELVFLKLTSCIIFLLCKETLFRWFEFARRKKGVNKLEPLNDNGTHSCFPKEYHASTLAPPRPRPPLITYNDYYLGSPLVPEEEAWWVICCYPHPCDIVQTNLPDDHHYYYLGKRKETKQNNQKNGRFLRGMGLLCALSMGVKGLGALGIGHE
jgi:hypothetical protein